MTVSKKVHIMASIETFIKNMWSPAIWTSQ